MTQQWTLAIFDMNVLKSKSNQNYAKNPSAICLSSHHPLLHFFRKEILFANSAPHDFLQSNGSSSSSFKFVRTQNDTENKLVPKSCIAQYQHKHNTNSKHFMTCEPF